MVRGLILLFQQQVRSKSYSLPFLLQALRVSRLRSLPWIFSSLCKLAKISESSQRLGSVLFLLENSFLKLFKFENSF